MIAIAFPSLSLLTLPYPNGLSKTVVNIDMPSLELSISSLSVFSLMRGTSPYKTSTLSASVTSSIPHLTASPVPFGFGCSHEVISRLKFLDLSKIDSLSKPTMSVIFLLIFPAVWQIISSIVFPPILCRDFALFDFILEPSPAARTIVCTFTIYLRLNRYLTVFCEVFE